MKKLIPFVLLSAFLLIGLASCSDDDEQNKPIHSVEVTSEIVLSQYADKNCYVNSVEYSFTVEGNKLIAKPRAGGEIAYTDYNANLADYRGGVSLLLANGSMAWGENTDQSTLSKMMSYDMLFANLEGKLPSNITGLNMVHRYSMISFTIKNLPLNATVAVKNSKNRISIAPSVSVGGVYQCVSPLAMESLVSLTVDGKEYVTSKLYDTLITPQVVRNMYIESAYNIFYILELEYKADAEKDDEKFVITDLKREQWVNQHFSILNN